MSLENLRGKLGTSGAKERERKQPVRPVRHVAARRESTESSREGSRHPMSLPASAPASIPAAAAPEKPGKAKRSSPLVALGIAATIGAGVVMASSHEKPHQDDSHTEMADTDTRVVDTFPALQQLAALRGRSRPNNSQRWNARCRATSSSRPRCSLTAINPNIAPLNAIRR